MAVIYAILLHAKTYQSERKCLGGSVESQSTGRAADCPSVNRATTPIWHDEGHSLVADVFVLRYGRAETMCQSTSPSVCPACIFPSDAAAAADDDALMTCRPMAALMIVLNH